MSDVPPSTKSKPGIGLAAIVFLIFVLLGPPLGAVVFIAVGLAMSAGTPGRVTPWMMLSAPLYQHLQFFRLLAGASYLFGGFQAAGVGLVAAVCQRFNRDRRVPWLPVLLASIAVGAAFLVLITRRSPQLPPIGSVLGICAIHIGAGLGCCVIANLVLRLFRPRLLPERKA